MLEMAFLEALADRLLALSPRPTGLFAWADMLTAALYPCLHRRGLQPGREISVVSRNNEWPLLFGLWPRPAVVHIQRAKLGRRALEQWLCRMQNRREPDAAPPAGCRRYSRRDAGATAGETPALHAAGPA